MRSYRLARRSFMSGVGAAVGLKILLRNLEAAAQGATSPPRFLLSHFPVGTARAKFMPGGSGATYTTSPILQPFETAGLREDMIVLYGLTDNNIRPINGGGHEAGTPLSTTGAPTPGNRVNGGEADDALAGGPSLDQIFLKHVTALQKPGKGYANAICDSRVDSLETSTQCLSYSYTLKSTTAVGGATVTEAVPLLPTLKPSALFAELFANFVPGGSTPANQDAVLKGLRSRKSVLDFCKAELAEIGRLAPGSEKPKIESHTAAIESIEKQIQGQIDGTGGPAAGCAPPTKPADTLTGKTGSKNDYGNPAATTSDEAIHAEIGKAHAGIIRAAFQCDLIRVATFQFSPGTNHVSFKGMDPTDANKIWMYHPLTHREGSAQVWNGSPPTGTNAYIYNTMVNIQIWYNQRMAEIVNDFKLAKDALGNSLLDYTIIPYITEVAEPAHTRGPKPAIIFGGKALGMIGGQFQNLNNRPHNDVWATIAQAYFKSTTPLTSIPTTEPFYRQGCAPIAGLWKMPA